jgi:hypothetical protein
VTIESGEMVGDVEGEEGDVLHATVGIVGYDVVCCWGFTVTNFVAVTVLVAARESVGSRELVEESENVSEDVVVLVDVISVGRNVGIQLVDRVSDSEFDRTGEFVTVGLPTREMDTVDEFETEEVPVAKTDDVRVSECVGMTVSVGEGVPVGVKMEDVVGV